MADIQRRKYLNLDPEDGVPGNANTIDLPNPRLVPLAPRPAPSLQQYLPRTLTPTPTPPPAFPSGFGLLSDAPKFLGAGPMSGTPDPAIYQSRVNQIPLDPPGVARPLAARAAIRPQAAAARPPVALARGKPQVARPAAAAAAFKFPTSGPRTQGYQAGSAQARGIAQMVNNPAYVPQAGSGLITSSNGTAYSIRPPDAQPAAQPGQADDFPQGAYQPRSLGGLIAGLAVGQIHQNRIMRQQKLDITQRVEAQRQSEAAQRLGIDQQNANANTARVNRERHVLGYEERPGPNGIVTIKVPRMFNAETGLPVETGAATGGGVAFDQFKSGVANVPAFKGMSDADLMNYWKRNHGGQ